MHEAVSQHASNSEATLAQPDETNTTSYSMITPAGTETKAPLLQLPGEIRNIIYKYALTDEELHYARGSREYLESLEKLARLGIDNPRGIKGRWDNVARLWGTRGDPNPLKYVCRQLYTESAGLEFNFNKIVISKVRNPVRSFARFLTHGNLPNGSWLTTVILRSEFGLLMFGDPIECTEGLLLVAKFCKDNPRVTVKYFDPAWSEKGISLRTHNTVPPRLFMIIGIYMTEVFRGIDLSFLLPPERTHLLREFERRWNPPTSTRAQGLQEMTPNFRIYPLPLSDTSRFGDYLEIGMIRWELEEEMEQLWRDMIEFWVEEGA